VTVYTDGSCFDKLGMGGWGVYIVQDDQTTIEFSGYARCSDSITMELLAIAKAFEYIHSFCIHIHDTDVVIYTDCDYMVKLAHARRKKNKPMFPLRDKISRRNKQLLFEICNYIDDFRSVTWMNVKSHRGVQGNEIADALARKAAETMSMKGKLD